MADIVLLLLAMLIVTAMVWLAGYSAWLAYTVVKDKAPKKKSKEQLMLEKQRRLHLLLTIDVKYGGLDKAEGSPELEELRELVGAYKIESN